MVYSKLLKKHQDESLWCCLQHSDYDRGGVRAPRRLQRRAFACANPAAEELGLRASESKALSGGALPQPNSLLRLLYAVVLSRSTPSPLIYRDRPGLVDSVISPAPFPRGARFVPASEDDDKGIKSGLAWLQVRAMASILHLPGREPCSMQGRRLTCSHCSPPGSSGTNCLFRGLSITESCLLSTISTSSLLLSFLSNTVTKPQHLRHSLSYPNRTADISCAIS